MFEIETTNHPVDKQHDEDEGENEGDEQDAVTKYTEPLKSKMSIVSV